MDKPTPRGDTSDRSTSGNGAGRTQAVSRPFLAVGPTLHYSHQNVRLCWLLGVAIFCGACLFWAKVTSGSFWSVDQWQILLVGRGWHLQRFVHQGLSVFEYPWQILVLGLLMGTFAAVPLLTAQLLSFAHSLPFIAAVLLLANLPGVAVTLAFCCVGVACRPLRFRSRIIGIALCMAPLLAYWGAFGRASGQDPISWGVSFAPWITAWLVGLLLAGLVLGVGHLTRYRPGLVWSSTLLAFLAALLVFENKIGFDELAFQLYVKENNPEEVPEFHPHGVTEVLDATIKDAGKRAYLAEFFYPTEPIPLREELKREMTVQLNYDRWPVWIDVERLPVPLRYQEKREWLLDQYARFISPPRSWWMPRFLYTQLRKRRATSPRMATALYYRAMLLECAPDPGAVQRDEVLRFYNDHPLDRARETWHRLYAGFKDAPEALEAYWRIAVHWAGLGRFEHAEALLQEARQRAEALLQEETPEPTLFRPVREPSASLLTRTKLLDRVDRLASLIGPENRGQEPQTNGALATFVRLNPYALDYPGKLETLLQELGEKDPLRDNVLLAQAKLEPDELKRENRLWALHQTYMGSDGGREALYELALLKVRRYQGAAAAEQKQSLLAEAKATLASFLELYRQSILAPRVEQILEGLPAAE